MTSVHPSIAQPRNAAPLILAGAGVAVLAAGIAIGGRAAAYGAVAFLIAILLALGETYRPVFTWKTGIVSLILVIWFIPIKKYRLPVDLPFDLEPYRLLILLLGFLWLLAFISGRVTISAGGQRAPLLLLVVASVGALLVNIGRISEGGLETQSIKSLSFFLSFLLAFVLISSTLRGYDQLYAAVVALVVGAVVASLVAIYERQSGENLFDHLQGWLPFLEFDGRTGENVRAGRLRVRSSAQHPIALGVALIMCLPLVVYLARAAATRFRAALWLACGVLLLVASFATISRTVVLMLIAIAATVLWLRPELRHPRSLVRLLPLLVVVALLVKVAAPGSLRTLYASFTPQGGLISEQQRRAGDEGSGRIADLGPALDLWLEKPILGRALGTGVTRADTPRERSTATANADEPRIIFDNQYLHTLIYLGLAGLVGVLWFLLRALRRLGAAARRVGGAQGDLLVACAASCAAFGVSMAVFDAFAFVQASLVFFVIAALGLRMLALTRSA